PSNRKSSKTKEVKSREMTRNYRYITLFLFGLLQLVRGYSLAQQTDRPNILWIISDDLGNDLGCYGNADVYTPHLDRLAAEGVRFTSAYATAPVCSPSRSSLITGMYPVSINSLNHRTIDKKPLPNGIEPITTYFREAGYFCANANEKGKKGKEDYNFATEYIYDGIDWSERKPDQPFFAQIQIFEPHRPFVPDTERSINQDQIQIDRKRA